MNYITQEEFNKLEQRVSKIETLISDQDSKIIQPSRPETLTEFLKKKELKSAIDQTICIMYFLEIIRADEFKNGITSEHLKKGFRQSRTKTPANIADNLNKSAKKGWIQEINSKKGKKLWQITRTGIKYVEHLDNEQQAQEHDDIKKT